MRIITLIFIPLLFIISGCTSRLDNAQSAINRSQAQTLSTPAVIEMKAYLSKQPTQTADATSWWEGFKTPPLNQLIKTALEASYQVRTTLANLEAAKSQLRASRASLFPSFNLGVNASVEDNNLEDQVFDSNTLVHEMTLTGALLWQTDLFGQTRNQAKSANALVASTEAALKDVQRLLVQEIITNYFRLKASEAQKALALDNISRRTEHVDRIDRLLKRGYATALDKSRTDNQLYQSKANSLTLDIEFIRLSNALALLSGQDIATTRRLLIDSPKTDLKETKEIKTSSTNTNSTQQSSPGLPHRVQIYLPNIPNQLDLPNINQLIHHRPDLRAAELNLLSAAFQVNASKAALYPSLSLSSNISKEGLRLGSWPSLGNIIGSVSANLTAPIFGRGRLLAAIDTDSARLKSAHVDYERTLSNALIELDTSLVSVVKSKDILEQRKLAAQSANKAAEVSYELFQAGEADYTSVIVAEQTRSDAEQRSILAHLRTVTSYIQYRSAVAPIW